MFHSTNAIMIQPKSKLNQSYFSTHEEKNASRRFKAIPNLIQVIKNDVRINVDCGVRKTSPKMHIHEFNLR